MTRRFALTLALLVVTLALVASAAPVGAQDINPDGGSIVAPPVATGACANTGQTLTFTHSGTQEEIDTWFPVEHRQTNVDFVTLKGNGFTTVDQNGLGMGVGVARCDETMKITAWAGYDLSQPLTICPGFPNCRIAFRVVSATFHGGAHLAPGTQMNVNLRVGPAPKTWDFHASSNFPSSGYNGDYALTIPNTVSPLGNDWSTCGSPYLLDPATAPTLTVTNTWSFSKWDGGRSTLTGDHNGKYSVDYTLEWAYCG